MLTESDAVMLILSAAQQVAMNELEQLAHDVRGFATEVRRPGYSSVANGHENRFLELSERMTRRADGLARSST